MSKLLSNEAVVKLDMLLEHITSNCYDYYHGFGPTTWVIDAEPLMDALAKSLGVSREVLGEYFDQVRARVHGSKTLTSA